MTTERTTDRAVPEDTLALRLVIARVYRGHYNAASAALAVGVPRQSWSNWERGKPIQHQDAMLAKIARTLDVDEDWLRNGGPLGNPMGDPNPGGPGDPSGGVEVRHPRLERGTRWFDAFRPDLHGYADDDLVAVA